MVCFKDYETDHPQKYLRVRETGMSVPFIREDNDEFLVVCNMVTSSCYSGLGASGCMQSGNDSNSFELLQSLDIA